MTEPKVVSKFKMGQLVATPGALAAAEKAGEDLFPYVRRHLRGDWGDVDVSDKKANDAALSPLEPARLLSAYHLKNGTKIWIITEWDRSVTTVLLPEEY